MSKLFALCWRFLLAAALVFNPVAAGLAMAAEGLQAAKAETGGVAAKMPPCHGMAMSGESAPKPVDPGKHHGSALCPFGACCLVLSLHVPTFGLPAFDAGRMSPLTSLPDAAKAPPPARMIRPPIA